MINQQRIRVRNNLSYGAGSVLCLMQRDQRCQDNWALLWAQELALLHNSPLAAGLADLPPSGPDNPRARCFSYASLHETVQTLADYGIVFFHFNNDILHIADFVLKNKVGALVCDFNPLKKHRIWLENLIKSVRAPIYEVDAHNIVPCWVASPKKEYSAATFRPKIKGLLADFLDEIPGLQPHPIPWPEKSSPPTTPDYWLRLTDRTGAWLQNQNPLNANSSIPQNPLKPKTKQAVSNVYPGEKAARNRMNLFIEGQLAGYDEMRNNPNLNGQSGLSPYLHFGQLSAQRLTLEILKRQPSSQGREAFLEELIVRRELADNFCYYEDKYENFEAFPAWAQKTLNEHRADPRPYIYDLKSLESAQTHDRLWNAAQMELLDKGKIHGYLRMYWAKKILEWSPSPEEALKTAIYLNDKYSLDGEDPNGYAGIAWSIGGLHDRPWSERLVFGKIRYMSEVSITRKYRLKPYIEDIYRQYGRLL